MRRLLPLVFAVLILLAGCGSSDSATSSTSAQTQSTTQETTAATSNLSDDVAATVDGVAISVDELNAVLWPGSSEADQAGGLRRLIINQVLEAAVIDQGITVTPDDEARARAQIEEVAATAQIPLDEFLSAQSITPGGYELIVRQSALADAVDRFLLENAPPPRDEDLQEIYDEQVGDLSTVCSAHILLETQAEADDALARAAAGEDFGALAMELSTGPSGPNGGDLGCSSPGVFVGPFADATLAAEVGVPYGPVETQFGFHVILVTDRTVPTLDELRDELAALLIGDVFPVWLTAQIEAATVEINPVYGTWERDQVIPPR